MMRRLLKLTSIANLTTRDSQRRGQIATFLLLGLVALLVFAIATANLGKLSLTTIKASNAADSATLLLGSQLATKANVEWQTLGQRIEKCKRTGLLALVLAIIFVVIALTITILTWGAGSPLLLMAVGALAGAVGGAIGGSIAGTGALQGALQGAMIGAAIGAGVGGMGGPVAGPAGATFAAPELGGTFLVPAGAPIGGFAGATPIAGSVTTGIVSTTAAVAGGTSAAGSAGGGIFNAAIQEQMTADSFTVAAKAISGLPERDSLREGVFLYALSQTVNDPNKTAGACFWPTPVDEIGKVEEFDGKKLLGDPFDADADGNVTEQIPCFEFWWDRRIEQLKKPLPQLRADIEAFFNGPMSAFEVAAESPLCSGAGSRCGDQVCDFDEQCGWASQCPADCGACGGDGGGGE